ncbi:MAG: hypothetical protein GFH25_541266n5 [Chloroflexi bacterium AL-N10]|nr:hypothetical protein [Chloroflexi bacterium AL-N10]NOK92792.1 hypothetical protein [Chloroflexi bacterium AL-N15]
MSNSLTRSEAVRKYFTKTPVKPSEPDYSSHQTKMGIGGGLLFLALILLFSRSRVLILLGIVSGYFGFKLLSDGFSAYSKEKKKYKSDCEQYEKDYAKAEPKPSDQQMDKWLEGDIEKIIGESLRRLDLEHEDYISEPRLIGGPASLKETKYARGKDGKTRYSHFNLLVVYLTEYHVAAYQCVSDMEYGQVITDNTQEFPYKEITNLGTQTVKEEIKLFDDVVTSEKGLQEFTLATSGANVIRVAYAFARNADSQGELLKIGEERTIAAIRKKLQDYKQKYER